MRTFTDLPSLGRARVSRSEGADGSRAAGERPAERVLVCASGGPLAESVIRAGQQLANSLQADWVIIYVETPEHYRLSDAERERLARTLKQAEMLGVRTVVLPGQNVSREVLNYARANGFTKIVVGKPRPSSWSARLRSPVADELVRASGDMDVLIVTNAPARVREAWLIVDERSRALGGYVLSLFALAAATLFGLLAQSILQPAEVALIYLLAVVVSATTWGLAPSIFSSILAVILLDALFLKPLGLLSVSGVDDLLTLVVFLVVGVVISQLGARLRAEVANAREREQETAALYALSRELAFARERSEIIETAVRQFNAVFNVETVVLLPGENGALQMEGAAQLDEQERRAARAAFERGIEAGSATFISDAAMTFLPLQTAQGALGVLGLRLRPGIVLLPEQRRLLETFIGQVAIALERAKLSAQAEQAQVLEASEKFRSALLSSISHDLRTPLASILGSATTLLDPRVRLEPASRYDLALTIQEEAARLNRLVSNLLNMTRVESGALGPRRDWYSLEEVIGSALAHFGTTRPVHLDLAPDLPLAPLDFVLIEQVLINLLDNAIKFSPPQSPLEVSAQQVDGMIRVCVADRGIGIPEAELERVFDKFYRVGDSEGAPGSGLGLSICKGIVEAHGGSIRARRREGGGTCIEFTLPLEMKENRE